MPDITHDTDNLESYWADVHPPTEPLDSTIESQEDPPAMAPPDAPVFNEQLEYRIDRLIRLLARGDGVQRTQTQLILLAVSFGLRPENVPDGMLTSDRRLMLGWAALGPYYPRTSPPEALALARVARQLDARTGFEERHRLARDLEEALSPWTRR